MPCGSALNATEAVVGRVLRAEGQQDRRELTADGSATHHGDAALWASMCAASSASSTSGSSKGMPGG